MKRIIPVIFFIFLVIAEGCKPTSLEPAEEAQNALSLTASHGDFVDQMLLDRSDNERSKATYAASVETRVTETAFQNEDAIGLFIHSSQAVEEAMNHSQNMRYTTSDQGASWRAGNALGDKFESNVSYYATAYYPYSEATKNPLAIAHSVAVDQSAPQGATAEALEKSDFMISAVAAIENPTSQRPQVRLTMSHLMAKLVVAVNVPVEIDGQAVIKVKSVAFEGLKTASTINLATKNVSAEGGAQAIKPRTISGDGLAGGTTTYEAIVVPQTVAAGVELASIICETDGGDKKLSYKVSAAAPMSLTSGRKVTLTLNANDDLSFTKELDLIDGVAKTNVPFGVKVVKGAKWTLTAPASGWLTLAKATTDAAGYSIEGVGTGAEQIVYVTVAANSDADGGAVRQSVLTLTGEKVGSATYIAVQNYLTFGVKALTLSPMGHQGVFAVEPFLANQEWTATSDQAWLKIATSATYGSGTPSATASVAGDLAKNTLFYQLSSNETGATRTAKITYKSTTSGVASVIHTITQGAIPAHQPSTPTPSDYIEIGGLRWAKGNLVAADASNCKIGQPTDGGLYFQFGSLIAWSGGSAESAGSGQGTASADHCLTITTKPKLYTATPDWATSPYYKEGATIADQVPFASDNGASAIGDPCRYYLGGDWRLPTTAEYKTLCNGMGGAGAGLSWTNCNAAWQDSPAGGNFNINSTKFFIVASASRLYVDGSLSNVGTGGYGWSASVSSASNGYGLGFYRTDVYSQADDNRANAFPARCVEDLPTTPQPPTADQVVTINGLRWTKGNLVALNKFNCKVGTPTDGGLYFKFGSLVGWTGGASGDGVGVGSPALAVKVKPVAYSGSPVWTTCPKFTEGTDASTTVSFSSDGGANGIGDPCRLYLGSPWRLPTAAEYKVLCNNQGNGAAWASCNAAWQASPPGVNFNNNSTKLYISASGLRGITDGLFSSVGTDGFCWSSSVASASDGFSLGFNNSIIYPQGRNSRGYGFPVRCVAPDTPAIKIGERLWATGNLVADGNNGAKIGAPNDGGLCFKFGSLIGWTGGATASGDGTGITAGPFPDLAIKIKPAGYAANPAWADCPIYTSGTSISDRVPFANDNGVSSLGDPCRYYLGAPWRLPIAEEYRALCNNAGEGSSLADANIAWQTNPYGCYLNNNSNKLYSPASGYRESEDGRFNYVWQRSYGWSSSVYSVNMACVLNVGLTVFPMNNYGRGYGFPVRCVQ